MRYSKEFEDNAIRSLDNDLKTLVTDGKANLDSAIALQQLRILRGRPFKLELNPPSHTAGNWSPDGIKWQSDEPGNITTGNGTVPPETK